MCCKSKFASYGLFSIALLAAVTVIMPRIAHSENESETKLLRHVVMFKFKDDASEAEVKKVVDAFRALPTKIPQIHDFEYGTDNSPEGLADGFTHCFLVTFTSEDDREKYLPHPAHQAFVEVLKPHLDKVMVIDYWAGE
jgi:hypothetical protein